MKTAVVISGYKMPSAIQLQIRAIRAWGGLASPIMVADDASGLSTKIKEVCAAEGAEYTGGGERRGHAAGYLASLYDGLKWAERLGVESLTTISQRYVMTRNRWLSEAISKLDAPIMANVGEDITGYRYTKTALVILRMKDWAGKFEYLAPMRIGNTIPVEAHLFNVGAALFDGKMQMLPWGHKEGLAYTTGATTKEYARVAASLGVILGSDFSTEYFRNLKGYDAG